MVRNIPTSVLFSFPVPNYINPETRGSALIIVNAIFLSLCAVTVFLRLYTRIFINRRFGSDDVFIIFAFITTIGLTVCVVIANQHYYWNRHIWDVPLTSFPGALKIGFSAKLIFVFASVFTRQSLLCFYYRLVADSNMSWFISAVHTAVVVNVATCIAFTCVGVWLCTPIRAYWTIPSPAGSHCLDEGVATLIVGIANCIADLLVTVLPIPIIMRLQMPIQQRVGVTILLSLGFVVIFAGVVRTYFIWKGLMDSYDETWFTYPLWICAAVEIDLGVICACAPALRPLMRRHLKPLLSSLSSNLGNFITTHIRSDRHSETCRNMTQSGGTMGSSKRSKASSKPSSKYGTSFTSRDQDQDEPSWMAYLDMAPRNRIAKPDDMPPVISPDLAGTAIDMGVVEDRRPELRAGEMGAVRPELRAAASER